jgi:hypothetical protein
MSNELNPLDPGIISSLILKGDISGLDPRQRVQYVTNLCQRIGLDPLTQPFQILKLQGKEVLYATKCCTQQLCKIYGISTEVTKKEKIENVYVVTVRASDKNGRFTDDDGAVTINKETLGDTLANALMKAVTKAKRRAVLAFCGLGMLDETEIETIRGAKTADVIDVVEEEKRANEKIQMMRQSLKFILEKVDPKDATEVFTWHNIKDIESINDTDLGSKVYVDLRKRIKTDGKE